jgi:predicted AAA+ superfamily ATPase
MKTHSEYVNDSYMPRVIDPYLDEVLEHSGAVLIEGARWCGKTRTAEEKAASRISLQDPSRSRSYLEMADLKPSLLLDGDTPRLIDEWQMAPGLWNAVKYTVDERRGKPGQFILTGSASPPDDPLRHSGAGRIAWLKMRPMSLLESKESDGSVSMRDLFEGKHEIGAHSNLTVEKLSAATVRGGWPGLMNMPGAFAMREMQNYVESIINVDISKPDGVKRSPAIARELMRSLSRNVSSVANMTTIRKDMAGDDDQISDKTVSSYINALRRIFIVEDVPAWNPSLRSKAAAMASPKRHFVDPSIAATMMRATPKDLLEDLNTFGLLFESLCVRDMRVYSQVLDGEVFHYRDRYNLEADAVIHLNDGRWGAVEVKLGANGIEKGAENLKRLRNGVDTDRMKPPSFLMILTATEYAYKREDGVLVVPIGCLRD